MAPIFCRGMNIRTRIKFICYRGFYRFPYKFSTVGLLPFSNLWPLQPGIGFSETPMKEIRPSFNFACIVKRNKSGYTYKCRFSSLPGNLFKARSSISGNSRNFDFSQHFSCFHACSINGNKKSSAPTQRSPFLTEYGN